MRPNINILCSKQVPEALGSAPLVCRDMARKKVIRFIVIARFLLRVSKITKIMLCYWF